MKIHLGSYEDFRADVKAAEFLESAALAYGAISQPATGNREKNYADCIQEKVEKLSKELLT